MHRRPTRVDVGNGNRGAGDHHGSRWCDRDARRHTPQSLHQEKGRVTPFKSVPRCSRRVAADSRRPRASSDGRPAGRRRGAIRVGKLHQTDATSHETTTPTSPLPHQVKEGWSRRRSNKREKSSHEALHPHCRTPPRGPPSRAVLREGGGWQQTHPRCGDGDWPSNAEPRKAAWRGSGRPASMAGGEMERSALEPSWNRQDLKKNSP